MIGVVDFEVVDRACVRNSVCTAHGDEVMLPKASRFAEIDACATVSLPPWDYQTMLGGESPRFEQADVFKV